MSGGPDVRQQIAEALTKSRWWSNRWMPERDGVEGLAAELLDTVERIAADRAAEALGAALSISATRGPLEAVAWMARRHAEAMAAGRRETT